MSARFAPVASLQMYRELQKTEHLGSYHLLIATEVVKQPDEWHRFWTQEILTPPFPVVTPFIIMDNGLIETGQPTDPDTLLWAAGLVGAGCVVLPDVLLELEKTIKLASQAMSAGLGNSTIPKMGVVQGRTMDEILTCAQMYARWGVEYLSVSRVMTQQFGSRLPLLRRITDLLGTPGKDEAAAFSGIHLLGFSENLADDMEATAFPGVMGIDSATPIWYGLVNMEFMPANPPRSATAFDFGKRPADYWTRDLHPVEGFRELNLVGRNIQKVRSWMQMAREAADASRYVEGEPVEI